MQEAELIESLRAGEESAFRQLYEEYGDMVFRLCLRLLESREEAEDAVQDIFCKILLSLQSFREDAKLSSWMYRITLNHCLNAQRQKRRARWFSLEWLNGLSEPVTSPNENPHVLVERQEDKDLLAAAINSLPDKQRTALVLSRLEGKSYQEIAEITESSISAVESRLFQAKKNLCKKLLPMLKNTSFE